MTRLRPRHPAVWSLAFVGLIFVGGVAAFWFGLRAFRAYAEDQAAQEIAPVSLEDGAEEAVDTLPSIALLASSSGDVGRALRTLHEEGFATIDVFATLPPLDQVLFEYRVWLLKDGLTHVVDIGALSPRADGTWAGIFLVGPSTDIENPLFYPTIVLTQEERNGDPAPSGQNIARGLW